MYNVSIVPYLLNKINLIVMFCVFLKDPSILLLGPQARTQMMEALLEFHCYDPLFTLESQKLRFLYEYLFFMGE